MKNNARRVLAGIGRLTVGYSLVRAEELLFDFILYPYVLLSGGPALALVIARGVGLSPQWASRWGGLIGFGILFGASIVTNFAYVRLYDRLKTDWFGFEKIREWENRLAKWRPYGVLRVPATAVAFVVMSVWQNPLLAILLFRTDTSSFQMRKQDWGLFALAILAANMGWTAIVLGAATLITWCARLAGWLN